MTNRYRSVIRDKTVDRLDMTASQNQVMTASRPHGGYKGTHQHPPSRYSFNKNAEYQQQLQEDLDKLLQEDQQANAGSPTWAVEASKVVNHAGKSQLFNKKLLAASKIERHLESIGYGNDQSRRPSASSQRSRPASSSTVQSSRPASRTHCKPNSAHQYLTDTMLLDEGEEEVEFRLGRPTRTTLLRARQRCNSAPVNSYAFHKEEFQKTAKRTDARNRQMSTLSAGLRSRLGSATDGQSLHSFLTGARYNRAHYFDAKCVTDHGLYMPRSNPLGAFLMRPSSAVTRDKDSPPASPDSSDSESLFSVSCGGPTSASPTTKVIHKSKRRSKGKQKRKRSRNMKLDGVGIDYQSRGETELDSCMDYRSGVSISNDQADSDSKTTHENQPVYHKWSTYDTATAAEETVFNFMDKRQSHSMTGIQEANQNDLSIVGRNVMEIGVGDVEVHDECKEEESLMSPAIRCQSDVKNPKCVYAWSENEREVNCMSNQQILDEEPRDIRLNRPKSSKFRHRPKSAAVDSVERKPYATNTITIDIKDQEVSVQKPRMTNGRTKTEFHPKVKPTPKYFQGVRIQGQSLSNVSAGYCAKERNSRSKSQSLQRPKTGKARKTGVTVKDLSHHLRKENILVGGKPSPRDDDDTVDQPSSSVNGDDRFKWEFQNNNDFVHRDMNLSDQRSCPSPVDTPNDDVRNDQRFHDKVFQDDNLPVLKSSLQRVGSAKPKGVHVHFAVDVNSPRCHASSDTNAKPEDVDHSTVFCASEDKNETSDNRMCDSSDLSGGQHESQQNEATFDECMTSPDVVFMDESAGEFHLELDPPDDTQDKESSSLECARPVSRVGIQSEEESKKQEMEENSPENVRMLAPRENIKQEIFFNDEEPMELESVRIDNEGNFMGSSAREENSNESLAEKEKSHRDVDELEIADDDINKTAEALAPKDSDKHKVEPL